jgi:hypothetical protein
LPIADLHMKHHGSFGSLLRSAADEKRKFVGEMVAYSATLNDVDMNLCAASAVVRFELPVDLEGNFVVTSDRLCHWKLSKGSRYTHAKRFPSEVSGGLGCAGRATHSISSYSRYCSG